MGVAAARSEGCQEELGTDPVDTPGPALLRVLARALRRATLTPTGPTRPIQLPHPGFQPGLGLAHTPAPTTHTGISSPSRTWLWVSSRSGRGPRARSQARASSSSRPPWEPSSWSCTSACLG